MNAKRSEILSDIYWTKESIKGLFRSFIKKNRIITSDSLDYFKKISESYYALNHSASNSSIFCKSIKNNLLISQLIQKKNLTICDLGCGYGELFDCIKFDATSNICLVDFCQNSLKIAYERVKREYRYVDVKTIDIRNYFKLPRSCDLVFSINVLPYIENIESLFKVLGSNLNKESYCVFIYPLKSLVWEEYFDGIKIFFHDPNNVENIANNCKMRLIFDDYISIKNILTFNLNKHPLAKISIFKYLGSDL